jgi:hypothetical protein
MPPDRLGDRRPERGREQRHRTKFVSVVAFVAAVRRMDEVADDAGVTSTTSALQTVQYDSTMR